MPWVLLHRPSKVPYPLPSWSPYPVPGDDEGVLRPPPVGPRVSLLYMSGDVVQEEGVDHHPRLRHPAGHLSLPPEGRILLILEASPELARRVSSGLRDVSRRRTSRRLTWLYCCCPRRGLTLAEEYWLYWLPGLAL